MRGLIKKYEKIIEELEERINFYTEKMNESKTLEDKEKMREYLYFYKGKKEAIEEILDGKEINYYL